MRSWLPFLGVGPRLGKIDGLGSEEEGWGGKKRRYEAGGGTIVLVGRRVLGNLTQFSWGYGEIYGVGGVVKGRTGM